ncbi:MAG TPA: T9SS type A sorting domain-containing protein, partial [Rhodothermales bacterium]
LIIDSDVAIAAAMEQGGSDFVAAHGLGRIMLDAGDLSATFPFLPNDPLYLVTVYGAGVSSELSFRAVLDPTNGQLVHSEQSGGTASDPETEVPEAVTLGANYPNPFNPQTTIPFELTSSAPARLTVHDALGRQVAVLVDGSMPAGAHAVTWDAANQPSGVYFYRLSSAGQTATGKMILQK